MKKLWSLLGLVQIALSLVFVWGFHNIDVALAHLLGAIFFALIAMTSKK